MKKLLILGASEIQVPVIQRAKELGHWAIVVDMDEAAPGMKLADSASVISTNDIDLVLELARQSQIDGILTTSDFPVRTVAQVGKALGLPVLPVEAAEICTDKAGQRRLLRKLGLPCPAFCELSAGDTSEVPPEMQFPVIVKPVDSSASRGVQKVNQVTELARAVDYARKYSRSGLVIVEEFIFGREFSVEVLIQDGVVHIPAITEKTTSGDGGLFFVEERHVIPANLTPAEVSEIHDTVSRAVLGAGLNNCASHTEVKLSGRGVFVIEMAARLGGDFITSDLVPLATGVDMLENIIRMSLGQKIEPAARWSRFSGVQFITPENHSAAAKYLPTLSGNAQVAKTNFIPTVRSTSLKSSMDRLGYIIAATPTRNALEEILTIPQGRA